MTTLIKRLSHNDLAMAKVAVQLFLENNESVTDDDALRDLLTKDDFYFIVAMHDDRVVGRLVAYEFTLFKDNTREVYLYEIDVIETYKKQGIGTKLIDYTKDLCKERKVSHMFVGTEEDNIPAQKLYKKTGGRLEGHLPHFTFDF